MMRLVAAAALVALTACGSPTSAVTGRSTHPPPSSVAPVLPVGFALVEVTFDVPTGGSLPPGPPTLTLWLADEPEQRSDGLTGVTDLGGADGMLFAFDDDAERNFWMWQTPTPLEIAFFDDAGRFIGSAAMEPCMEGHPDDCERYNPGEPFRYAIEFFVGGLDAAGVDEGWTIVDVAELPGTSVPG